MTSAWEVREGDSSQLANLPLEVDAVICDPPYGIDIAGWDAGVPPALHWHTLRAVTKPGGWLMAFGGARLWHHMAMEIERAGWEITADSMAWLYGTGFAKGTRCLRPGFEPIIVARNGAAGLNIPAAKERAGKWPTNVVLDAAAAEYLDERAGFFYCAKPSVKEKEAGTDGIDPVEVVTMAARMKGDGPRSRRNNHPTVKPIKVMEWLVTLATAPGETVLDPFMGSGTTGCAAVLAGRRFVGVEKEPRYVDIARHRIAYWASKV